MRIRRQGDAYRVQFDRQERELLARLAAELRGLVATPADDPGLRRLFPAAHEDADVAAELEQLLRPGLATAKARALEELERTAGADRVTRAELESWATALNDLRLVLGTRYGVTEDMRDERYAEPGVALYAWLTWVQGAVVEALAADL